jgi:hypothetical protein
MWGCLRKIPYLILNSYIVYFPFYPQQIDLSRGTPVHPIQLIITAGSVLPGRRGPGDGQTVVVIFIHWVVYLPLSRGGRTAHSMQFGHKPFLLSSSPPAFALATSPYVFCNSVVDSYIMSCGRSVHPLNFSIK